MAGKKKLVGDVNNVASNIVPHNSTNVLRMGPSGSNVIERVHFIGKKTKSYARSYFKTMRKSINPIFHTWVVIKCVAVKVDKFGGISL